jgi:hypothetical protein
VTIAGLVTRIDRKVSKRGNLYAQFNLEDLTGSIQCSLFGMAYKQAIDTFFEGLIVRVRARYDSGDERRSGSLVVNQIDILNDNSASTYESLFDNPSDFSVTSSSVTLTPATETASSAATATNNPAANSSAATDNSLATNSAATNGTETASSTTTAANSSAVNSGAVATGNTTTTANTKIEATDTATPKINAEATVFENFGEVFSDSSKNGANLSIADLKIEKDPSIHPSILNTSVSGSSETTSAGIATNSAPINSDPANSSAATANTKIEAADTATSKINAKETVFENFGEVFSDSGQNGANLSIVDLKIEKDPSIHPSILNTTVSGSSETTSAGTATNSVTDTTTKKNSVTETDPATETNGTETASSIAPAAYDSAVNSGAAAVGDTNTTANSSAATHSLAANSAPVNSATATDSSPATAKPSKPTAPPATPALKTPNGMITIAGATDVTSLTEAAVKSRVRKFPPTTEAEVPSLDITLPEDLCSLQFLTDLQMILKLYPGPKRVALNLKRVQVLTNGETQTQSVRYLLSDQFRVSDNNDLRRCIKNLMAPLTSRQGRNAWEEAENAKKISSSF